MTDKYSFMAALSSHGYNPIDEGGCIMIVTPDKSDLDKMQEIAEKGGFAGNGSYGWRKIKSEKTDAKGVKQESKGVEPVYSEEEKKVALQRARDLDRFDMNFLETIQNEEWYDDTKRVLKEYAVFLDDPDEYMTTLYHH